MHLLWEQGVGGSNPSPQTIMRKGGGKVLWKKIPNFGRYEISECGKIRRLVKLRTRAAGSFLKGHYDRDGYLRYTLVNDAGKKHEMLGAHRLVASVFLKSHNKNKLVCHKDDTKSNNHYSNLYWGTPKLNSLDAVRNGAKWVRKHEASKNSKLNWKLVNSIRSRYVPKIITCRMLATEMGVSVNSIWLVITNKTWVAP